MDAKEIFYLQYGGGKNFITPNVIEMGLICDNLAYEIASGEGMDRNTIYGVTVVSYDPVTKETSMERDFRGLFRSRKAAFDHIKYLKWDAEEMGLDQLREEYA